MSPGRHSKGSRITLKAKNGKESIGICWELHIYPGLASLTVKRVTAHRCRLSGRLLWRCVVLHRRSVLLHGWNVLLLRLLLGRHPKEWLLLLLLLLGVSLIRSVDIWCMRRVLGRHSIGSGGRVLRVRSRRSGGSSGGPVRQAGVGHRSARLRKHARKCRLLYGRWGGTAITRPRGGGGDRGVGRPRRRRRHRVGGGKWVVRLRRGERVRAGGVGRPWMPRVLKEGASIREEKSNERWDYKYGNQIDQRRCQSHPQNTSLPPLILAPGCCRSNLQPVLPWPLRPPHIRLNSLVPMSP